jgi:hypothetical protein
MKKIIVTTAVCCSIFAAFVAGQNQTKEKHIEPCCCKHTQQIAEDLHWIREKMSKPYVPPEIPLPTKVGNPENLPPIKVTEFNFTLDPPPNYRTPKKPTPKK